MRFCLLCNLPLPRRWWHRVFRPMPICMGRGVTACHTELDRHALRARAH